MNGCPSSCPRSSRVARISCSLRTSTNSPGRRPSAISCGETFFLIRIVLGTRLVFLLRRASLFQNSTECFLVCATCIVLFPTESHCCGGNRTRAFELAVVWRPQLVFTGRERGLATDTCTM